MPVRVYGRRFQRPVLDKAHLRRKAVAYCDDPHYDSSIASMVSAVSTGNRNISPLARFRLTTRQLPVLERNSYPYLMKPFVKGNVFRRV